MNVSIVTKNCHAGPIGYEDFNGSLNTKDKHKQFLKCSWKMTAPQWVIGCEYTTFQTLCNLLRPLGK